MPLTEKVQLKIEEELERFITRVIKRVKTDPKIKYNSLGYKKEKPFHAALLPEEIIKLSKFERSFSTSLGQTVFERIAEIIGTDRYEKAARSYRTTGHITQGELDYIEKLLRELEFKSKDQKKSNWKKEVQELENSQGGPIVTIEVISDLYIQAAGKEMYFEIKSSKPNADQTKVSKEKLLKLQAMRRGKNVETYFALPDNPYVTKENYSWSHPKRYFDMEDTNCVLMGKDFWDYLGGKGTWEELIEIFQKVGKKTKKRIFEEFLRKSF
ncbi:MAG: TdeIII family type II restriction endonuclease [Candidatus Heimdallarchaeota archaeon]|nr:TdeIII family type II restriction endonuclease [Candidatus Heimdallarchaeota archaeon]